MQKVVLIPGDGIGPEITEAVVKILKKGGAEIEWVDATAGLTAYENLGNPLPDETVDKIREHKVALKGPLTTPVGSGFRSINVKLRQIFNLYSNIRPATSIPGLNVPFSNVDLVLFRENTQGLYSGIEEWKSDDQTHAESVAVITTEASTRIITAAFEYAKKLGRKKVTLVHKANILKFTTGLFLDVGKEIAKKYPDIEFEDLIVDNTAMQMVMRPQRFDVMVTTNLFGDILSDLASGLVGGLGLTGSANIGDDCAIFEAVHGSAPDIAGQGKANPTALLFSAIMMLDYLGQTDTAAKIRKATLDTLNDPATHTGDLGGNSSTRSFAEAICSKL